MKYLFIIPIIFIFSCSAKHKPPELTSNLKEAAVIRIKKDLINPESYEPIEWSPLDTSYHTPDPKGEFASMEHLMDSLNKVLTIDFSTNSRRLDYATWDSLNEKRKDLMNKMERWKRNMPQVPSGWWTDHKFKATGKDGIADIFSYRIRFDKQMNIDTIIDFSRLLNRFK